MKRMVREERGNESEDHNRKLLPKNRPNFYGAVPGVEIGRIWETRIECSRDGIMRPPVAGIYRGTIIKSF